MSRKRKSVYEGYLTAADVRDSESDESIIVQYWNKVKHHIYMLGDAETDSMIFLNREFEKIAKKYEGIKVRITIEPLYGKRTQSIGHMPTPEEEYEGFELFKRRMFSLFKIS
jgi:hypothetical protein